MGLLMMTSGFVQILTQTVQFYIIHIWMSKRRGV